MTIKPWMILLGLGGLALLGLTWWITRPVDAPIIEPALTVPSQPMGSQSLAVKQLLMINEQAASLAGYPAIVKAEQRHGAARQSARQIAALINQAAQIEAGEAEPVYLRQQTAILKQMQAALQAYADGENSEALLAASAANAALRADMESRPGIAPDTTTN